MNIDWNNSAFVSAYDSCPFWSSQFAYTMMDEIKFAKNTIALDVGSGTGFPAIEIAERLGNDSIVYALDTWDTALERAKVKIEQLDVTNVKLVRGTVLDLPFVNGMFHLITSNNCLNNIDEYDKALVECSRVLLPGGMLIQTFNLPESLKEFYDIFRVLLQKKGMNKEIKELDMHIFKQRKDKEYVVNRLRANGFNVLKGTEHCFSWPFTNGSSLLNYSFVKCAWLPKWEEIVPEQQRKLFFEELEHELNVYADKHGGLLLKIPYACVVASKQET